MIKKAIIFFLIIFLAIEALAEAKNKVVIKISCTIPPLIELKALQQDQKITQKDENRIIQEEKRKEKGKVIIIKTLLLR